MEVNSIYKECKKLMIIGNVLKCSLLIDKTLKTNPNNTNLLILRAFLYRKQEKYEQALNDLELAYKTMTDKSIELELIGQIGLTYNEMGSFLFKNAKYNEALTIFTEAIKFKDKDWGIYVNKGDCFLKLNQKDNALNEFLKAQELGENQCEIKERLAECYYKRGIDQFNDKKYEIAKENFDEMIKYNNNQSKYLLIRAKCLLELGNIKEAYNNIKEILKNEPNNIEALHYIKMIEKPIDKKNKNIIFISKEE